MKAFWNVENLEDVILLCGILFTVNRDKDIARESFSFKIIWHSLWLSFYHLMFLWFFSSPDPKGHVSYCHHLASGVRL
jgi:hypothetical protein